MRKMGAPNLAEFFAAKENLVEGENDLEYFKKIDAVLSNYEKRKDSRTKEMCYTIIKVLRIIDNRKYCTQEDLNILQYIMFFLVHVCE